MAPDKMGMNRAGTWKQDGWVSAEPDLPQIEKYMGVHLVADVFGCDAELLGSPEYIQNLYRTAAELGNCTVVSEHYHLFEPWGVSGVTVLSESHLSHHSWDEDKFVAVDLFFCGDKVMPLKVLEHIARNLKAETMVVYAMGRGCRGTLNSNA